ncbi:MAG: DNA polymerase III subunit delta [Anaerolineae bacterium]|nr:DNA polymerase III subunit delta [Anaerolineae bacterium]MDW8173643.1 DNA polymerase III subunit delta [Anaerolineae bacterium]
MSRAAKTFLIYHGQDELGRDEALAALLAQADELNTSTYEGSETSVPAILGAVRSLPFLAERRTVVVKDLISYLASCNEAGKVALEQLVEALPNLPPTSQLIMVERGKLDDKKAIIAKLLKLAQSHPNGALREFNNPEDISEWIIKRAKNSYAARITPRAAHALSQVVSQDLRRADHELLKLASYVDGARPIDEDDVALLTPYVAEANVFKMIDAVIEGRAKEAIRLLHAALDQDPSDPGFGLFGLIVAQFRTLLLACEHLSSGGSPRDLPSAAGVKPFLIDKVSRQARAFKLDELEAIYKRLQRYDQDAKTGKIDIRLALDLFVVSLAR